jgi:hypothetical protein
MSALSDELEGAALHKVLSEELPRLLAPPAVAVAQLDPQ